MITCIRIFCYREQTIAQYKINIRLCKGSWRDKSYRDSAKGDLLECINAAGNSYGNNVVMDCSETEFGPKGELNTFYKAIEENELHDLVGEELVKKKATLEKELNLHVPMFKKFRSLKTNAFVPKFESVNMKNDDLCRAVLCDVKKGIRDGQKRLQIFTELEGQIKSDLEQLGYNAKINEGKESPAIQFKYLSPNKKQNLAKDCFNERNKLQKYVSAFATYNGGVILYGIEDGTGYAKGQILSSNKSDDHSFDKICETLKKEIPNHTLWWDCDIGYITASKAQMFFTICQYPIVATHIPENESRTLLPNEYLAVICIAIKPFVGSRDQQGPRDGTVFGSKDGAEGYRIDENLKKIHRLTFDEWLKAMRVQSTINDVAGMFQFFVK